MSEPTTTLAGGVQRAIGERIQRCQQTYARLIQKHAAATAAESAEMTDALIELSLLKNVDLALLSTDASAMRRQAQLIEMVESAKAEVSHRKQAVADAQAEVDRARSAPVSGGTAAWEQAKGAAMKKLEQAQHPLNVAESNLVAQKLELQRHQNSEPFTRIVGWKA